MDPTKGLETSPTSVTSSETTEHHGMFDGLKSMLGFGKKEEAAPATTPAPETLGQVPDTSKTAAPASMEPSVTVDTTTPVTLPSGNEATFTVQATPGVTSPDAQNTPPTPVAVSPGTITS